MEVRKMLYEGAATSGVMSFTEGTYATDTLLTFLLGLGIVFVGLIALVAIVKIMGAIMEKTVKKATPAPAPAPAPAVSEPSPDHGELVATISAALATVMGKQVNGIRILSLKKVD